MIIGLDVYVYVLRDEDLDKVDLGLDVDLADCDLADYTFYNIDYVHPYQYDKCLSVIGSCGDDFIVRESIGVLKHRIGALQALRFN